MGLKEFYRAEAKSRQIAAERKRAEASHKKAKKPSKPSSGASKKKLAEVCQPTTKGRRAASPESKTNPKWMLLCFWRQNQAAKREK